MTDLDHRPFTIPLFSLGALLLLAGLVGLVVDATTDLATNNPAGAAATGALLLFASVAVVVLLDPLSTLGRASIRAVAGAGAFAIGIVLVAAIAGSAALGAAGETGDLGAAGANVGGAGAAGAATAEGFLRTDDVTGSLRGASAPGPLAMVGGAGSPSVRHDVTAPASTRELRVEVHWEPAGAGGADALDVDVQTAEGETIATGSGGPGLTLDVEDVAPGAALVLVVSLPAGAPSTGQEYEAYVSYFAGPIPISFTAHDP